MVNGERREERGEGEGGIGERENTLVGGGGGGGDMWAKKEKRRRTIFPTLLPAP